MTTANLNPILQAVSADLQSEARASVPLILREALQQGITDRAQLAYILATADHESKLGRFMREQWDPNSVPAQRDYDAPNDPKGLGNRANPSPNENYTNGDGYRYRGRGFVQITGRSNYANWSRELGIDLINNPAKTEDPAIAAKILVRGMQQGSFTRHKLSEFLQEGQADFYNARRIVNGLDKADHIAGIANSYFQALQRVDINELRGELNAQPSLGSQLGPAAPPSLPTLKPGDRSPAVQSLQSSLNTLGYPLAIDGSFGPATAAAVKNLQQSQKLIPDGIVGPQTWQTIQTLQQQAKQSGSTLGRISQPQGSTLGQALTGSPTIGQTLAATAKPGQAPTARPTVQRGDRGQAVSEVQTLLKKLGYGLEADGSFGPQTEQAVRNFQTSRQLTADAIVGPQTWQALQQVQQRAIATELGGAAQSQVPGKGIKLDPLRQPAGNTFYGAPRPNGRRHAGVDTYNPNTTIHTEAPKATFGGIIVNVGTQQDTQGNLVGYGHYIDIHNPKLGVVERIAEYGQPRFTEADRHKIIPAGTVVGTGATQTQIIHREIRPYESYKRSEYGFEGTVDWAKYVSDLGLYRQEGNNFIPTGRTIPQQYGAAPEAAAAGTALAEAGRLNELEARSRPSEHLQATATAATALQSQLGQALASEQLTPPTFTPIRSLADLTNQLSTTLAPQAAPDTPQPTADLELG